MPEIGLGGVAIVIGLIILEVFILALVGPQIQQLATQLPGPLSQLAGWIGNVMASLATWQRNWMEQAASGFAGVINTWLDRLVAVIGELTHTVANTIDQANAAPSQAVGIVQQTVVPAIQQDIGTAVAYTTAVQQALDTEASTLAGQIDANHQETQAWVDNLSTNVQAFNDWTIQQLQDHSATEAAIESEARSWVDNLSSNVQAFNAWTVQQLQSQAASIGQVESEANQWAGIAQTNAEGYAASAAAAAGAGAVNWTIANVVPEVQAVANAYNTYQQDCGNTLCEGMLPSAKGLKTLAELAGGVELISLVVAMITDPSGAADAIESVIGPLAQDAISGIRAVTGV